MKYGIVFCFFLFINFGCSQIPSKPMAEMTAEELSKVVLLDVRTPEEFSEGHIPNAININWFDEDFLDQADKALPKDQTIYLYCRSGRRSGLAAEKLVALGYTILNLEGGYQAYQKTED